MKNAVDLCSAPLPWLGSIEAGTAAQHSAYESFVDEHVVGLFLDIPPRRVLEMARKRDIPAYPIGRTRKTWRFRISEIDAHFRLRGPRQTVTSISKDVQERQESQESQERKQLWVQ
jgi:hypothetical protein